MKALTFDPISRDRLQSLHPSLQSEVYDVLQKCYKEDWSVRIDWAYRSHEEQQFLYKFGRTISGRIITNHPAGFSWHEYGLAVDICYFDRPNKRSIHYHDCDELQQLIIKNAVRLFKKCGWDNGDLWLSPEPWHVEKPHNLKLSYVQYLRKANKLINGKYPILNIDESRIDGEPHLEQ